MKNTIAAVKAKTHDKLEEITPVRNRSRLLTSVLIFAVGMLVGRLPEVQQQEFPNEIPTCNLSNVAAVFLDDPSTEQIERWDFTNGEGHYNYQDRVLFLTVQGETKGPFLVAKTQDK